MKLPKNVKFILDTLHNAKLEGYAVGGCVRDVLLGKTPKDWDICTNAKPEKVCEIFKNFQIIPTGLQHGTVTVIIDKEGFEITTYRIDGEYSDGRHPDNVCFTGDLSEDLARRDITINAMAFSEEEGIVDLYDGIKDLKNKVIRCVGKAEERFDEDALRVLRVLRFASILEFEIEAKTKIAVFEKYKNLDKVAKERINVEFSKTLMGKGNTIILSEYREVFSYIIPQLKSMFGFEQNNPHHSYDVWEHTLRVIQNLETVDISLYLAGLFHDIGKPLVYTFENGVGHFRGHAAESVILAENIMKDLKLSNQIIEETLMLIKYHDIEFIPSNKTIRKLLNKIGKETLYKLVELRKADIKGQSDYNKERKMNEVLEFQKLLDAFNFETECFDLKSLKINGNDLINMGFKPGKKMGEILNTLFKKVVDEELENDYDVLKLYIERCWHE